MSLAALKSRSTKRIDNLVNDAKKAESSRDTRFWSPTSDKAGNSFAVVRFLPERDDEKNNGYVKLYKHYIDSENGKYMENCLTTIGQNDPAQNFVSSMWKLARNGDKAAEDVARKMGRKARYFANILVVEDKEAPENEGKVFIWEFGQKVYDKLEAMFAPEGEYEERRDPWDIFGTQGGANFKVKLRKVGGFTNYDLCGFDSPSQISLKGKPLKDEAIEEILDARHELDPIIASDKFKSYAELEAKFNQIINNGVPGQSQISPRQKSATQTSTPRKIEREPVSYDDDAALIDGILGDEDED